MQAVILAAGEGRRLRPLTEDRPKPMVLVGGKPILEHTLATLPEEIDEIILVVGYKQEKIKEYFGNSWAGRKIIYVDQPEPKGNGEAVERARSFLRDGRFIVLFADDLYHPHDVRDCVRDGGLAILAKGTEHPERMGICLTDENGFLKELIEKPEIPPSNLADIGVFVLDHDVFDMPKILVKNEHYLTPSIGALAQKRPIKVLSARFWHPIGYPEDVEAAEKYMDIPPEQRSN
ncbi:MAG: sugar phosphate nucleotidyltransferase [Candidatus Uhrbacteria bacterium]|nr:sugar phosphate nucleotidyltransferase [Candidatus Uhrbacteria bacterium]